MAMERGALLLLLLLPVAVELLRQVKDQAAGMARVALLLLLLMPAPSQEAFIAAGTPSKCSA
jgi:hypothetical protein